MSPTRLHILLLVFVPLVVAQNSASRLAMGDLPYCALECLTTALVASPCKPADQECICANDPLRRKVDFCVRQACTVKQGLITKNITMATCKAPPRDRSGLFKVTNIILGVISSAVVLLRLTSKIALSGAEFGLDDYSILITIMTMIPGTIINDQGTLKSGLGKDIWMLEFPHITNFVRFFYVLEVLYFAQLMMLKLSFLSFYHRIFPGVVVKRVILATAVFNIIVGVAFVVVGIFQCQPIDFFWNSWDREHSGKCINTSALGWASAAISIALDIWMLAIPMSQLVHLKLAWKKKVSVGFMFGVGSFVTVVSILRLPFLVSFDTSENPTWDYWNVIYWSNIEISIGITCACMPAIRVLLVRLFRKHRRTSYGTSNQYHRHTGDTAAGDTLSWQGKKQKATKSTNNSEVQRDHTDGDEIALVDMDDIIAEINVVESANSSHASL
ncbi:hypothetical protein IQ07DRAFT_660462 [Pyrenochaeta sp. DS3sAY3a]|nr:hypothetical protein IQ07DRAFT_660462 [Pyrenochaeta sp. DS3sAY3a]